MAQVISDKRVWVIMSKDRTLIAKGTVRNRELVRVNDLNDKKRYLTYNTKGRAESAFRVSGFYGQDLIPGCTYNSDLSEFLEAVEVSFKMEIV